MDKFWVAMVKNATGIDISNNRDCMQGMDSGMMYGWFIDVDYNGTVYSAVKVYPDRIEFYKDHPSKQTCPTTKFTIGSANKHTFF
jgi:hypothetical protein